MKEQDENSLSRQKKAASLPMGSRRDFLSLLGDKSDETYPIYMKGNVKLNNFQEFLQCE